MTKHKILEITLIIIAIVLVIVAMIFIKNPTIVGYSVEVKYNEYFDHIYSELDLKYKSIIEQKITNNHFYQITLNIEK